MQLANYFYGQLAGKSVSNYGRHASGPDFFMRVPVVQHGTTDVQLVKTTTLEGYSYCTIVTFHHCYVLMYYSIFFVSFIVTYCHCWSYSKYYHLFVLLLNPIVIIPLYSSRS